jgi:hypothetical protein
VSKRQLTISAFLTAALVVVPASAQPEGGATKPREPAVEAAARVGAMFAGEMSPVNWFRTETKLSPLFSLDAGWVLHPNFSLGPYLQLTPFSFERKSGSNVIGTGTGTFVSLGAVAKGRLTVSEKVGLRGGLTLGRNFVSYEGESDSGAKFKASGGGFNVGLVADAVWRASAKVGASAQFGFVSQLGGSADVEGYPTNITAEGDTRDFDFAPIFFLTVGPELFF